MFRRAKRTNNADHWSAYHRINGEFNAAASNAKESFYTDTLPSLLQSNPRKFWSIVSGTENKAIQLVQSNTPISPSQCCSVLNNTFSAAFTGVIPRVVPPFTPTQFMPMDPIVIDSVGIDALIRNLKISSSAGPDCINSKMLKCTEVYSSVILPKIFDQSLHHSILPRDWKVGKISPVPKSGDVHCPDNYRPISLTSIPCKTLEHNIFPFN